MAERENLLNTQTRADDASLELAASIREELVRVPPSPSAECCCIHRLHEKFRRIKEYAYTPQLVSIGPFHRDKTSLKAMEDNKLRYADDILKRTGNVEAKRLECVTSIRSLLKEARNCYSEPIDLDDDKFTRTMIIDGLFIIELFLKSAREVEVIKGDPIFSNKWVMSSLVRDMILFENQLPMSVLDTLFAITVPSKCCKSLKELAVLFFNPLMRREPRVLQNCFNREGKHLLEFLGNTFSEPPQEAISNDNQEAASYTNQQNTTSNNNQEAMTSNNDQELTASNNNQDAISNNDIEAKRVPKHVPCVTELRKVGVKFKKRTGAGSFLDIKFSNGVMEIPPLLIQDQTDTLLRNLIAREQYSDEDTCQITSYASLMDSLIDSSSDIEILRNEGIITNWLGDNEYVSSLFNKLCHEVTLIDFHYAKICDDLNKFHKRTVNLWLQDLREYFRTPWKAMSIIVAGLILVFTAGSFIVTILSFSIHKS